EVDLALHGGVQGGRVHHLVEQADAHGFLRVEDLGAGEPAAGLARADGGDDVGRDHRGQQAELAFGEPELRLGYADGDVAGGDQADAAAEGRAVDAGGGRARQFVQGAQQAGEGEGVVAVLDLAGGGHAAHPVEVGAGGEARAFAFEHHHAYAGVGAEAGQGVGESGDQGGVEGVVQLRAVETETGHRPFAAELERGL